MKPAQETRAEDLRLGDVWHMTSYTPGVPSDGQCERAEEFAVIAVERVPVSDSAADILVTLDNGVQTPMRFPARTWVLVHRGES